LYIPNLGKDGGEGEGETSSVETEVVRERESERERKEEKEWEEMSQGARVHNIYGEYSPNGGDNVPPGTIQTFHTLCMLTLPLCCFALSQQKKKKKCSTWHTLSALKIRKANWSQYYHH